MAKSEAELKAAQAKAAADLAEATRKAEEAKANLENLKNKTPEDDDPDDDEVSNYTPEETKKYIAKMRSENRSYRTKSSARGRELEEVRAKAAVHEAELAALKARLKKEEEDKLAEQGEYKTLAEKREAEKTTAVTALQRRLMNEALARRFDKKGYPESMLKMVDLTGLVVGEDGEISGLDKVIERFENAHEDILEKIKGKPNKSKKEEEDLDDEDDDEETEEEEGTEAETQTRTRRRKRQLGDDHQKRMNLGNAGRDPKERQRTGAKKVDALNMSSAEYDKLMKKRREEYRKQG